MPTIHKDIPLGHIDDLPLRCKCFYKGNIEVAIFGRERNEKRRVIYYWVVDDFGNRFMAYPNELRK